MNNDSNEQNGQSRGINKFLRQCADKVVRYARHELGLFNSLMTILNVMLLLAIGLFIHQLFTMFAG